MSQEKSPEQQTPCVAPEQQTPRVDPDNNMSLEWHAARALGRKGKDGKPEFENLDSAARRVGISSPETKFREGDAMRTVLLSMLDRIEGSRSPEQRKLLNGLMEQRQEAVSVWTEKFPLQVPLSEAEMMARAEKWLKSLPGNVLQGLLEVCPDSAQLVIVPGGITAPELLKAIDKNKTMPLQTDGKVKDHALWDKVQADSWKIAVTDGIGNRPFDPGIYYLNPDAPDKERKERTNGQMVIESERKFNEKGLVLMPQYGYVPAAANRLAGGKVIDQNSMTAFKKHEIGAYLPSALWPCKSINLSSADPDCSYGILNCRPWIEGEM